MVRPPLAGPRPGTARTSLARAPVTAQQGARTDRLGTLHGEPASGFMLEPYHAVAA
jgi:hypothetical protein